MELFRRQVVDRSRARLYGTVRLSTPMSSWVVLGFFLSLTLAVGLFLGLGTYARKETVSGWLVPDRGLGRVIANTSGVVETVHVPLAGRVQKGDPIATVVLDTGLVSGAGTTETLLAAVRRELGELQSLLPLEEAQSALLREELEGRLQNLNAEEDQLRRQLEHQENRNRVLQETLTRFELAAAEDASSPVEVARYQESAMRGEQDAAAILQQISQLNGQLSDTKGQLRRLPLDLQARQADLHGRIAALEQREAEYARGGRIVLTASIDGSIASLPIREGQTLPTGALVASIIPNGGTIEAELFIPTRAAGFVEVGQTARLRLDAFPSQRFGAVEGVISEVSATVSRADELPVALPQDAMVYRSTVRLSSQSMDAYGRSFPLQPGMSVQADLIQAERALWQVLFDPLLAR